MSGYVTGLVLRRSKMKGSARLVLVVIADAARDDGTEAWPSIDTIADRAGIDRRSAQRAIRQAIDAGELVVEEGKGGPVDRASRYRTHRYSIPIDGWVVAEGEAVTHRGGTTPPLDTSGAASTTLQGRHLRHFRGGTTPPDTSLETSLETSSTRDDPVEANEPEDRPVTDDPAYGFERWWNRYPQRNGKRGSKPKSLALWKKLSYPQKAEAWRQLGEYGRIVAAGRPAMNAERWLRLGNESKWDPAEGWNAGDVQSPGPGRSGPDIGPARKPWAAMTADELAAVWSSLSEGERTEAEGVRRQIEISRRKAAGA